MLITVPASFDAAARDLTQRAAREAEYPEVTIIEEPQAAFYAWIARNANWREQVKPGDLILVVDIGGGTTDFSLIAVTEQDGERCNWSASRSENICSLAATIWTWRWRGMRNSSFPRRTSSFDAIQFHSLWQQCRAAKETLLSGNKETAKDRAVTILGRGTGLVGGTLRGKVSAEEVRNLLLEGFFPAVPVDAAPQRQRRAALMEVGLNYAADPAVTKHLAQFLRQTASGAGTEGFARPTHLLLNGGVLQAQAIEQRIIRGFEQLAVANGRPSREDSG